MSLTRLAAGLSAIDLHFRGRSRAILTAVLHGAGGVALVDPGPASCLPALERGLSDLGLALGDVTDVLLTHVHLDHAGATGTILRRYPDMRVAVHPRGARHVVDPSKLVASATRLYGDEMSALWGPIEPVPEARVHVLELGHAFDVCGRRLHVADTPGHASHHASFFDASSGVAFVGDTAGVRLGEGYVLPPTPPPDIDLALWRASVETIEGWDAGTLFLTHGGPVTGARPHLRALIDNLEANAELVRRSLALDRSDDERTAWFADALRTALRRTLTDEAILVYEAAAPAGLQWLGLARYWRTRTSGAG